MSQPQALPAEFSIPNALPPAAGGKSLNGPRVANQVDAPITSPVHLLQDRLQRLDEPEDGSESAYPYNTKKAPAWVRMALPVSLSIGLWAGILYAVGLID